MEIKVIRKWFGSKTTLGEMYINDDTFRQCYTLEDPVRTRKIRSVTAIPRGRYQLILNFSDRYKRIMPRILNVPNYEGILIHPGNTAEDTDGCILVGRNVADRDTLVNSRAAFNDLFQLLERANRSQKIWVNIFEEKVI